MKAWKLKLPCKRHTRSKAILKLVHGLSDVNPTEGTVPSEQTKYSINPSGLGTPPWSRKAQRCVNLVQMLTKPDLAINHVRDSRGWKSHSWSPGALAGSPSGPSTSPGLSVSRTLVVSTQYPSRQKAGTSCRDLLGGRGHCKQDVIQWSSERLKEIVRAAKGKTTFISRGTGDEEGR